MTHLQVHKKWLRHKDLLMNVTTDFEIYLLNHCWMQESYADITVSIFWLIWAFDESLQKNIVLFLAYKRFMIHLLPKCISNSLMPCHSTTEDHIFRHDIVTCDSVQVTTPIKKITYVGETCIPLQCHSSLRIFSVYFLWYLIQAELSESCHNAWSCGPMDMVWNHSWDIFLGS